MSVHLEYVDAHYANVEWLDPGELAEIMDDEPYGEPYALSIGDNGTRLVLTGTPEELRAIAAAITVAADSREFGGITYAGDMGTPDERTAERAARAWDWAS